MNWHKSTYSDVQSCIEVADGDRAAVFVRDTKDHAEGTLTVTPAAWQAFVTEAKRR
ncbi:DUF397 domain-containing protein [Streptomyces sp. NPDC059009]|uniref:DUF397 domain-containing protein n=1 Tax=Streptomyces sp. NPDC059009 TaxID=3346694 RepID=UPI0036954E07